MLTQLGLGVRRIHETELANSETRVVLRESVCIFVISIAPFRMIRKFGGHRSQQLQTTFHFVTRGARRSNVPIRPKGQYPSETKISGSPTDIREVCGSRSGRVSLEPLAKISTTSQY